MDRHARTRLHADRGRPVHRLTAAARTVRRALLLVGAACALATPAARAQHTSDIIPPSLTADSATRAALASRYPRDRSDTLPFFPTHELARGVYAVMGDTGRGVEGRPNAGFIVTRTAVVVIDALASPGEGRVLLKTIRRVTPLPVRYLILTHHHPDHTFGAIVFKRLGARVIAHPDRRTLANADGDDRLASDWTGVMGLQQMRGFAFADTPDIPVTGDTTFVIGGRRIRVMHPGAAHTAGDLMIWLPDDRVLFAGDVLVEDGVSMVVDGSSHAMLGALDSIDALHPRAVVPGHGRLPARPARLVEETRCYFLRLRATMRQAVENGVRMGQALAALPPADRDRPVSRASRIRRNAVRVYSEMERIVMDGSESAAGRRTEAAHLAACPTE